MTQVVPFQQDASKDNHAAAGVLSLKNMDPDFDGDGKVSASERDVYDRMIAADTDRDGHLTRKEVYQVIAKLKGEIDEAKGGIPISTLNPDSDGDGKVAPWETEVFKRIKDADADQSGSISVKELFGVIKGAAESDRQKRLFKRLFVGSVVIIVVLIGAMLAMGIASGEMIKESHVTGGLMTDKDGAAVRTDLAESDWSLFELPSQDIEDLAKLKRMNVYLDATGNAAFGNEVVESTFQLAGAVKVSATVTTFFTTAGGTITIDGTAKTGTLTMGGTTFAVGDGSTDAVAPAASRRERRLFNRASFLTTSGSFTLSSGSPNNGSPGGDRA